MLHLLIPAAGHSQRFVASGYMTPKGLLEFEWYGKGGTMIEHIVSSVGEVLPVTLGVRPEHTQLFEKRFPMFETLAIENSGGQADTVRKMAETFRPDHELLVLNCDNAFDNAAPIRMAMKARSWSASMAAMVFEAVDRKYGYVNSHPRFDYGAEKTPISTHALAGAFYFKEAGMVVEAHTRAVKEKPESGERYLSSLFEFIPGTKLAYSIHRSDLHEWGTPTDLRADKSVWEF